MENENIIRLDGIAVTDEIVSDYLKELNANKSPGPDTISPRVLSEVKQELAKPLSLIFNKSLESSTVPDDWKLANVTPIFKKKAANHYLVITVQ